MATKRFKRHHLIIYTCETDQKYYGALQPRSDTFWIREGDITFPEYGWSIKQAITMPVSWVPGEEFPDRIFFIDQITGKDLEFKMSHDYTRIVQKNKNEPPRVMYMSVDLNL
jgi:hypothetical protein